MEIVFNQTRDEAVTHAVDQRIGIDPRFSSALTEILDAVPVNPTADFLQLCKTWVSLTGAKWAWLWVRYPHPDGSRSWQLLASLALAGDSDVYTPSRQILTDGKPVVEYASVCGRPIYVEDIHVWSRQVDGQTYTVSRRDELAAMGCSSFLTVPLVFPVPQGAVMRVASPYTAMGNMDGAICLHFDAPRPPAFSMSEDSYQLVGRATSNAIGRSFAAAQHEITSRLNYLAAQFVPRSGIRPDDLRAGYLKEVIRVLQDHLTVDLVSIFYQTDDAQHIECIATTGLEGRGRAVPTDRPQIAKYARNEGITGTVFETGEMFVGESALSARQHNDASGKWLETSSELAEDERSLSAKERYWVACPIKMPSTAGDGIRKVLGVIRCVANRSRRFATSPRPFDPIQLQTLEFIALEIAPTLDSMTSSIRRDRTINIVKHDLYAPLRVIEDQADQLYEHLKGGKVKLDYMPSNIRAAVLMAKHLAGSLSDQVAFAPEATGLEGDIIARLRDGLSRFAWVENRMTISFNGLRDIPELPLDRNLTERAISNLLINAVKYGHANTEIKVVGEARRDCYVVRVENYGIGIQAQQEHLIFEGEYRSPEAEARKLGLGLGLKIARSAMRRHGGDLALVNGSGPTIFEMVFPKPCANNLDSANLTT